MAYAHVANTSTAGASGLTTSTIDTTGADLLIIGLACDDAYNTTPTDSKSNTWTQLTSYTQTNVRVRLWYSIPSSVGTSHTASASGAIAGAIFFAAFSGGKQTAPADQQSGSNGFVATLQPGSITPTEDNELLISVFGINSSGTPISIDSSYTETSEHNFAAGVNYGGAFAYKIQTTATAINPTWTRTNTNGCATTQASFKAAAAASSAIKTVNGLAVASVKTVNGLAIASVKTINGLA